MKTRKVLVGGMLATLCCQIPNHVMAQSQEQKAKQEGEAKPFKLTQTIRGTVVDADSKITLIGATIQVVGSNPIVGTTTDVEGAFRLDNIPVGRVDLQVSYIGYQSRIIPNVVVTSGREVILDVHLQESATKLKDVVVTATSRGGEAISEMALISARSISTEEMNRMSTGFNDPALITTSFAGVSSSGDGGNDIVVRGNSPKYVQWRLEGMPITNPNHFADQNASTGSTSALNSNLLATSDFYTGAFNPEYGDVLSGVYDVKLRNGNNETRETILGLGLIGTDLTMEGPFKKGYKGSYLVNYRYSTTDLFNKAGLLDIEGDPVFQDATFKLNLPTKRAGIFSVFGLGGHSKFALKDVTREDWNTPGNNETRDDIIQDYDKQTYLANFGVNHSYPVGKKSFIKTNLGVSLEGAQDYLFETDKATGNKRKSYTSDLMKTTYRGQLNYHYKRNAKNKFQAGVIYTFSDYKNDQKRVLEGENELSSIMDFNKGIDNLRSYISWKHRVNEHLTVVAGLHNTYVLFNDKQAVEPRLAATWQVSKRSAFNVGYGLHSSMESVHHYFAKVKQADGSFTQPNKDLDLLKAHHFVLGYDFRLNRNWLTRVEAYYQDLYNLPVGNSTTSHFATINEDEDVTYVDLVNEGEGENYGIELTLQRFFANSYYFMVNASVFESKYKSLEGIERNTKFNGNYIVNVIGGKEFAGLGKNKNQTLGLNAKLFVGGGKKIIPLLRDGQGNVAVDEQNNQYWDYSKAYEKSIEDLYHITLSASYKWDKKRTTHELLLNLENLTGNKGKLSEYYDPKEPGSVGYTTQFGLLPNLMYKIYF